MSDLPSIDWANCLELSHNKTDLAYDLLQSFVSTLDDTCSTIETLYQNGEIQTLNLHIHKLYGTCCYVGVPRLRAIMRAFEQSTKYNRGVEYVVLLKMMHQEAKSIITLFQSDFSTMPTGSA